MILDIWLDCDKIEDIKILDKKIPNEISIWYRKDYHIDRLNIRFAFPKQFYRFMRILENVIKKWDEEFED